MGPLQSIIEKNDYFLLFTCDEKCYEERSAWSSKLLLFFSLDKVTVPSEVSSVETLPTENSAIPSLYGFHSPVRSHPQIAGI